MGAAKRRTEKQGERQSKRRDQRRETGGARKGKAGKTSLGPVKSQTCTPFPSGMPRVRIVLARAPE
jgi:hypothetical protein